MNTKVIIGVCLCWVLILSGCEKKTSDPTPDAVAEGQGKYNTHFPGNMEGAKALLMEFLQPDVDRANLTKQLRPTTQDFRTVFKGSAAKQAEDGYRAPWDEGKIVIKGNPDQTELLVWSATTKELQEGKGDSGSFPGGYVKVAPYFKDGLTFYRFKFVRPGETLGYAWDGLIYVNGHWVIFPKPWRVLLSGS